MFLLRFLSNYKIGAKIGVIIYLSLTFLIFGTAVWCREGLRIAPFYACEILKLPDPLLLLLALPMVFINRVMSYYSLRLNLDLLLSMCVIIITIIVVAFFGSAIEFLIRKFLQKLKTS